MISTFYKKKFLFLQQFWEQMTVSYNAAMLQKASQSGENDCLFYFLGACFVLTHVKGQCKDIYEILDTI